MTGKVKASLANEPLLKEAAIDVDTADSVVTLKGSVTSARGEDTCRDPGQCGHRRHAREQSVDRSAVDASDGLRRCMPPRIVIARYARSRASAAATIRLRVVLNLPQVVRAA